MRDGQLVAAELEATDEPDEVIALAVERTGHVGAVALHAELVEQAGWGVHAYQRVSPAHLVGPAREHTELGRLRVRGRSRCHRRHGDQRRK